ncbi:MAG TPA: hypothetical protein VFZ83_12955, partial [Acidimicrobiia bacterium]|nr:hypothetical protein [Acidimicrobiia bacterium]
MSRARERRVLAALGVVVACWAALGATLPAARGGHTTADEPQYLLSALSLAEDRDLDIADERADERYRPFHRAELPVQEAARDDGSRVSPHDPLLPAFLAVPMGIGGWVAAKLALALVAGALAVALAWVAIHRFRVPRRVAVVVVGACCVAPPLAVYGTQVYPELPAALVVTIAIGALTGALTRVQRWVAVACIVALPWLAVKYVPVAIALVVFGGFRLARTGRVADATRAAAALVVAAAAFAVAHLAWYGGLTPYA